MSYFEDDDASQIRDLKDKLDNVQAQLLALPSSIQLENVETGQSIFPGANPSSRSGGFGVGSDNLGNHIATKALEMKDFAIFYDVAKLSSIVYLSNTINYTVDIVGGAHDFFVDDLVTPKFGITSTSIEMNEKLDMNLNEIIFDDISTPSTDATRAQIYAKLDGGVIKPFILWSDGTEKEIGSGSATSLNGLTDVTITSSTLYDHLEYDGTVWRNNSIITLANTKSIRWKTVFGDFSSLTLDSSDEWNWNPGTGTSDMIFNGLNLKEISGIENNVSPRPATGFLKLSKEIEIKWKNIAGTDDLIFDTGNDALGNQAFIFNVAAGNQLTISEFDIDVKDNRIMNTGDIEVGSGTHQIGTTSSPYNQMFSNFFVPKAIAIVTNRYALSKIGNTMYVNFDNTNIDAGFGIYEEGVRRFLFNRSGTTPFVNEFAIGGDPFLTGEEYRIQLGESGTSSARIYFIEGSGNDLILDRAGASSTQGVQIRGAGLSLMRFLSNELKIFQPLNVNTKDITNVINIKSNGGGTGVIGELITGDGGFNYFLRSDFAWEGDANVRLNFSSSGIKIETNGTNDDITIQTLGVTSDLFLYGSAITTVGRNAQEFIQFVSGVITISGANVNLTNGAEEIQFLDAVAGTSATTPAAGDINLFNDLTTGELSVKKPGGTVVSLEGGGGGFIDPLLHTITTITPQTIPTKTNIDSSLTNVFKITLDRDIEFDIINPHATKFEMLHLVITENVSGNHIITWPSSVNGIPNHDTTPLSETTISLYNMGDGTWRWVSTEGGVIGGGGGSTLDSLTDTVLTAGGDNEVLAYDNGTSKWINQTASEAGLAQGDLNNLGVTSINMVLLPNGLATLDLGSELLPWRIGHFREIEFPVDASVPSGITDTQISKNSSGNLAFNNAVAGGGFLYYFEGVNKWGMSPTTLTGDNIILNNLLAFNDNLANPSSNGQLAKNGDDVLVFSGNALRNMSNIGVAAGGADVFLSNLSSPTSVNQDLLPQAGKTLGDSGNPWSSATLNKLNLGTAGSFASGDNAIISDPLDGMEFHTPASDVFGFFYGTGLTTPEWTLSNSTLIGSNSGSGIQLENHLTLFDTAVDNVDPTVNGQFRNVGGRVKVRTNGVVIDLSDVGGGTFLPLSGGTMTGDITMSSKDIKDAQEINFGTETASSDKFALSRGGDILTLQIGDAGSGTSADHFRIRRGTTSQLILDETGWQFANVGIGFYGTFPISQQTGVAVTAAGIHAALVSLGLITA